MKIRRVYFSNEQRHFTDFKEIVLWFHCFNTTWAIFAHVTNMTCFLFILNVVIMSVEGLSYTLCSWSFGMFVIGESAELLVNSTSLVTSLHVLTVPVPVRVIVKQCVQCQCLYYCRLSLAKLDKNACHANVGLQ